MIRIGPPGRSDHARRGPLHPAHGPTRDRLERYAAVVDTVEPNPSFYRLPARETGAPVHACFGNHLDALAGALARSLARMLGRPAREAA
jgi:hypothetical protein